MLYMVKPTLPREVKPNDHPSPDIASFVMFDANGLYSLRCSATTIYFYALIFNAISF